MLVEGGEALQVVRVWYQEVRCVEGGHRGMWSLYVLVGVHSGRGSTDGLVLEAVEVCGLRL